MRLLSLMSNMLHVPPEARPKEFPAAQVPAIDPDRKINLLIHELWEAAGCAEHKDENVWRHTYYFWWLEMVLNDPRYFE